jgi:hypothetical protein
MKLKFGDLRGKADAEEHYKKRGKFEANVQEATMAMANYLKFPAPDPQLWEYPQPVRRFGLDVLNEARKRILAKRDL